MTPMSRIEHRAAATILVSGTGQKVRDGLYRFLRRGDAYSRQLAFGQPLEPFDG